MRQSKSLDKAWQKGVLLELELLPALSLLLQMRLHQAISLQKNVVSVRSTKDAASRDAEVFDLPAIAQRIPLKRVRNVTSIIYLSAIAHQLATHFQQSRVVVAAQLAGVLSPLALNSTDVSTPLWHKLLSAVTVQATATGMIQCEVGDRAIATWLDWLIGQPLPSRSGRLLISEKERSLLLKSPAIFEVQYAHARCCSLLRLAQREAWITLAGLEASPTHWRIVQPPSIAWLLPTTSLCLEHPADRSLISHLFTAIDILADASPQRTHTTMLRSTQAVAQAFQLFHSAHPLGSNDCAAELLTARLGLLLATQRVLYLLLSQGLDLCPAIEL